MLRLIRSHSTSRPHRPKVLPRETNLPHHTYHTRSTPVYLPSLPSNLQSFIGCKRDALSSLASSTFVARHRRAFFVPIPGLSCGVRRSRTHGPQPFARTACELLPARFTGSASPCQRRLFRSTPLPFDPSTARRCDSYRLRRGGNAIVLVKTSHVHHPRPIRDIFFPLQAALLGFAKQHKVQYEHTSSVRVIRDNRQRDKYVQKELSPSLEKSSVLPCEILSTRQILR